MLYCNYLEPQLNHAQGVALLVVNRPRVIFQVPADGFLFSWLAPLRHLRAARRPQVNPGRNARDLLTKRAGAGAPHRKKNAPSGRGRPARGSRTPARSRFGGSLSGCRRARRAENAQPGTATNDQDGGGGSTPPRSPPFQGDFSAQKRTDNKSSTPRRNPSAACAGGCGGGWGAEPPPSARPCLEKTPPR